MDHRCPQKIQIDSRMPVRGHLHHRSIHEQEEDPEEPTPFARCLHLVLGFQVWRNLSTRAQRLPCREWKQIHKTNCFANGERHSPRSQFQADEPICLQILAEIQENECGAQRWRGFLLCPILARNPTFRRIPSKIQIITNRSCFDYLSFKIIEKNKLLEQRNGAILRLHWRITLGGHQGS